MPPGARLRQIDEQILELLEERMAVADEGDDSIEFDDDEGEGSSEPGNPLQWWLEEGVERGMDETALERVYKAIAGLTK